MCRPVVDMDSTDDTANVDETNVFAPEVRRGGNQLRPDGAHGDDETDQTRIPSGHKPHTRKSHDLVWRRKLLCNTRTVRDEFQRAHVRVRWVRGGRRVCNDNSSFFVVEARLFAVLGHGNGCLGAVVERLSLEDEAEREGDGGEEHVHPVEPGEAHGIDNVATCNTTDCRSKR